MKAGLGEIHGLAVDTKNAADPFFIGVFISLSNGTHQNRDWHMGLFGPPGDPNDHLSPQALRVDPSLAGVDHLGPAQQRIKMDRVQHCRDSGAELCPQKSGHTGAHSTGCSAAGQTVNGNSHIPPDHGGSMAQSFIQPSDHGRVCSFLRGEHKSGPFLPIQRVVDIAHHGDFRA